MEEMDAAADTHSMYSLEEKHIYGGLCAAVSLLWVVSKALTGAAPPPKKSKKAARAEDRAAFDAFRRLYVAAFAVGLFCERAAASFE